MAHLRSGSTLMSVPVGRASMTRYGGTGSKPCRALRWGFQVFRRCCRLSEPCIYIYIYTYIYIYIHIYIHIYVCIYIYITYVYTHITYTDIHTTRYNLMQLSKPCSCMYTYAYTYIQTYTNTCSIQTYTRRHTGRTKPTTAKPLKNQNYKLTLV